MITAANNRSSSSRQARGALLCPDPRHELVETRGWPEINQLCEHVGKIGLRVDAIEFAGLGEGRNAGPALGAMIVARKKCVFTIENHRPIILPMSGKS
jgi:hypothetical protein